MEILRIVITVLFVIAALAIIVVVLMQEGKSAGLGSLNGTNNDSYWEKNKKNSLEGKFERWTKITAGLFVVFALVLMVLQSSSSVNLNAGDGNSTTQGGITVETPANTAEETTDQSAEGTVANEATAEDANTATNVEADAN